MSGSRSSSSSPSWSGIFGQGILSKRVKSAKLLFLIRLVFFFAFFYLLWYYLSPFYNIILAGVSEEVIQFSETGKLKITESVEGVEKWIWVYHIPKDSAPIKYRGNLVHFDMVLLFALIWAVPNIDFKKRLKLFLLGIFIIFGVHVIKIFVYVKHEYAQHIKLDDVRYFSPFQRAVYWNLKEFFLRVGNQLMPILVWSLLYVKHWWKKGQRIKRSTDSS